MSQICLSFRSYVQPAWICQSIRPSVRLSVHMPLSVSVCLCLVDCLCLSVSVYLCLVDCRSVGRSVCVWLSGWLSVCQVCLFVCLSVCLSVCLPVCQSVCPSGLFVCLSICLWLRFQGFQTTCKPCVSVQLGFDCVCHPPTHPPLGLLAHRWRPQW